MICYGVAIFSGIMVMENIKLARKDYHQKVGHTVGFCILAVVWLAVAAIAVGIELYLP